jgi:hypothetical protein
VRKVVLKCAVLKPGVYNLNRFRVAILDGMGSEEGEGNGNLGHFVNEVRLNDDILLTVVDTSKPQQDIDLQNQNLISFE